MRQVFTHTSWAPDRVHSYERLEFLGDSVLSLCITTELYRRFPDFAEGHLARLRAYIVSRATCSRVAAKLGLGKMLRQYAGAGGEGDDAAQLQSNQNVLADLTESLIGAVYVTFGYEAVRPAVIEVFEEHINFAESSYIDHKTELQEHLARGGQSVTYKVLGLQRPAAQPRVRDRGRRRRRVARARVRHQQEARRAGGRGRGAARAAVAGPADAPAGRGSGAAARAGRRRRPSRRGPEAGRRPAPEDTGPDETTPRRRPPGPPRSAEVYLKALRLKGFKSFPKQTELLFEPGVGVIIGPNGSGKSNLADAVIWALGEQSPTTVRGSSMQDVIFAGSDGRRASGSAEVELTFDNSDGALPLPTPEVSVMRRVQRDGSSQYSINQSTCRLTDVVELLAQVGLGKELHSIIGQGKVESFLAGKPEDRRSQIEEAAGLGAYKRRRERAELKLREVRRNLERALLLEREVGSQLAPLRRQATAAEQLRTVETEIAETRGRLLTGEVDDAGRASCRARRDELARGRRGARGLRGRARARGRGPRAARRRRSRRKLAERERSARRLLRARVLDGRLESVRRLAEQRQHLLDEVERAAAAERERLVAELAGRPGGARRRHLAAGGGAARRRAGGGRGRARARLGRAGGGARRRERAARRARPARGGARDALATSARLERRREALGGEQERLTAQHEAMNAEVAGKADEEREAAAGRGGGPRGAARRRGRRAPRRRRPWSRRSARSPRRRTRTAPRVVERRGLEAEADHLEAALRDMEDVGGEVLEVAGEFPGTVSLAGSVSCEAGYERALAAALAQLSGALAVPGGVDHWSLLDALKRAGVGLVRLVVPAPAPPVGGVPRRRAARRQGELRRARGTGGRAGRRGHRRRPARRARRVHRPGGHARGRVLPSGRRADRPGQRRAGGAAAGAAGHAGAAGREAGGGRARARRARRPRSRSRRSGTRPRARPPARPRPRSARRASPPRRPSASSPRCAARRRDLEDHLQRDRRSVEAIAAELAEAAAAKEAADEQAAAALLQAEQLPPGGRRRRDGAARGGVEPLGVAGARHAAPRGARGAPRLGGARRGAARGGTQARRRRPRAPRGAGPPPGGHPRRA